MSWNLRIVTTLLLACVLAACVLGGIEYLLTQIGVNNRFWYSLSKAVVITFMLFIHNLYFKGSTAKHKKGNSSIMFRAALSIVAITAIDLFMVQ